MFTCAQGPFRVCNFSKTGGPSLDQRVQERGVRFIWPKKSRLVARLIELQPAAPPRQKSVDGQCRPVRGPSASLWHLPLRALGRSPGTRQGPAPCKGTCQMWPYSWCRGSLNGLVAMDLQAMATNFPHHGESRRSTADQPIYLRRFAAVARTQKIRTSLCARQAHSVLTRRSVAVARATQVSLPAPSAFFVPPSHP